MLNHMNAHGLFAFAEHNYLRLEAMDLFERCLTEGSPDFLMAFIEQQLTENPPRLELLEQVAEDLHQRLLGLREYHFEVRNRMLQTLRNDFQVDLGEIAPPDALDQYHQLTPEQILQQVHKQNPRLSTQEKTVLRRVIDASLDMAKQLYHDKEMTEGFLDVIWDWTDGLSVIVARHYGLHSWEAQTRNFIH